MLQGEAAWRQQEQRLLLADNLEIAQISRLELQIKQRLALAHKLEATKASGAFVLLKRAAAMWKDQNSVFIL